MIKRILELFFLVGVIVWRKLTPDSNLQAELFGIAVAGLGVIGIEIVDWLIRERALLKLYLDCYKPFVNPELRLTISYLYRIEVNGKYLLVKSHRIPNTYQPVGGVYKYYNSKGKDDLDAMGAVTDNHIQNDDDSEHDIRLNLQDRKYLIKFLKWFFKEENREIDPWREFYEELVATGILPADVFPYMHYELVGQHFEPIHRDKFFKVHTFKYADIYVPRFWNNSQIAAVKNLLSVSSTEFIWATEQEIRQGKSINNHLIAEHTYKIFHNKKLYK